MWEDSTSPTSSPIPPMPDNRGVKQFGDVLSLGLADSNPCLSSELVAVTKLMLPGHPLGHSDGTTTAIQDRSYTFGPELFAKKLAELGKYRLPVDEPRDT